MMYHLGKHNQVRSGNVSQAFICRECGRLFCDSDSLTRHIIIHRDRLEEHTEEVGDGDFKGRATTARCPRCIFGCNCLRVFVQRAKTHENLKHYYVCEECNYITLTQQALEAHLHVAHQPRYRRMSHTENSEAANHVHFQCQLDFFSHRDKVSETCSDIKHRQSRYGDEKFAYHSKISRLKPNILTSNFKERTSLPDCTVRDVHIQKPTVKNLDVAQLKCIGSCTKPKLFPSLWRIDKHKNLLVPVEKTDAATELTCGKEALGSPKQTNCLTAPDILPSASKLKSKQKFSRESENGPPNSHLQVQEVQNSPSVRKKATPLNNATENKDGDILPRLSQRLRTYFADRESEEGCEGRHRFSDDTSEATGSSLESSDNERSPYAQRSFRNQSAHPLRDEDDGEEDCSDIEQLIIKEERVETAVCDESTEFPGSFSACSFDSFPTSEGENKPCPYCPAMFESGVGLSNHVRGHLHRVGLSYNARHTVSPEQVVLRERQSQIHRRIPTGSRKMRKALKPESQGDHACPLCRGWFDTKTGLSNHVRGHLKRMGTSVIGSNKSPLYILKELLKNKKEHRDILQILKQSHIILQPSVFQKYTGSHRSILMRNHIPEKHQNGIRAPDFLLGSFVQKRELNVRSEMKKLPLEAQMGAEVSSSTLFKLLKMKQGNIEDAMRNDQEAPATGRIFRMTEDNLEETQMSGLEPNWSDGQCDSENVDIQCKNTLAAAAATLPSHVQAGHRRTTHIPREPGLDYKLKKPRPGLEKKILTSLDTKTYTFTCRFCDLVFCGPSSIQEEWIKHLQRHLLHTSMPHSGMRMVEVLGLHCNIETGASSELAVE